MPVYHLILWSNDLGRAVACDLGEALAPARLEEFDEAGRCALRLSASAWQAAGARRAASARQVASTPRMAPAMGWTYSSG